MEKNWQIYPVITLYQPWATWIMRGWKTIETRTHNRFKGLVGKDVLIHSGKTTDNSNFAKQNPYLTKDQILHNPDEMINGYILGKVHIGGFRLLNNSHSKDALIDCAITTRFGLFLNNIEVFENPIPEKGEIGIWYYDLSNKRKASKEQSVIQTLF